MSPEIYTYQYLRGFNKNSTLQSVMADSKDKCELAHYQFINSVEPYTTYQCARCFSFCSRCFGPADTECYQCKSDSFKYIPEKN